MEETDQDLLPEASAQYGQKEGPRCWLHYLARDPSKGLLTRNKQLSSLMAESEQKLKSLDEGERQE